MFKVKNLSYQWPNENRLTLTDINLEVPNGSIYAIMGKSGCGKSTLLKCLANTLSSIGDITLNEYKISTPGHGVVALFQNSALFEWMTVENNLKAAASFVGADISSGQIDELLKDLDLDIQSKQLYPHQLSGGMLQRAAIARALAAGPQILLMDEPFSSLDLLTREKVYRTVTQFLRTRCVSALIVTHHVEEAVFMADKILILGDDPSSIRYTIDCDNTVSTDYATRLNDCHLDKVKVVKSYLETLA